MNLEVLYADLRSLGALRHDIGIAARRREGRQQVVMREHLVVDRAWLNDAGPADHRRHAEAAFPVGRLLAAERCVAAVRPAHDLGAVAHWERNRAGPGGAARSHWRA